MVILSRTEILSAEAMEELGASLVAQLTPGSIVYLNGDLGAGKTTLVRGFLRGLRYTGIVKSPTFTLVESYSFPAVSVFHFDLYRLKDEAELEFLGFRDYCTSQSICLIEWSDQAPHELPPPNLICQIEIVDDGRIVTLETP